jgi:Ca-activated chloride channel family protein
MTGASHRCVQIAILLGGVLLWSASCSYSSEAASADSGVSGYPNYPPSRADAGGPAHDGSPGTIPEDQKGKWIENDWIETRDNRFSTFSIDVDTASYTLMRSELNHGRLPEPQGVRVEEYINYFKYSYPQPTDGPFSINLEAAPSFFGQGLHLMRVGLQGLAVHSEERKPANLVFLIDVSGSMGAANKLDLVKWSLTYLLGKLKPTDTLGIVTYASTVNELLQPATVKDKARISSVINGLSASGGTAGGPGIQRAYDMAKGAFINGGINRVIICTDGDFNIGLNGQALIDYVEQKRKEGVTLSALGFGMGNYQDHLLETLSNKGNGNYAYIDSQREAERVFGDRLVSTLQVIAKDVKVQLEFNPAAVVRYRLVGYENRLLDKQDFKDDTKDAGEIGAGHSVTAFYETALHPRLVPGDKLATVRFRYKEPQGEVSKELTRSLPCSALRPGFAQASGDFRFAAAVVEFAEILRHSKHSAGAQFAEVKSIATATAGTDFDRGEFVSLVEVARGLWR